MIDAAEMRKLRGSLMYLFLPSDLRTGRITDVTFWIDEKTADGNTVEAGSADLIVLGVKIKFFSSSALRTQLSNGGERFLRTARQHVKALAPVAARTARHVENVVAVEGARAVVAHRAVV